MSSSQYVRKSFEIFSRSAADVISEIICHHASEAWPPSLMLRSAWRTPVTNAGNTFLIEVLPRNSGCHVVLLAKNILVVHKNILEIVHLRVDPLQRSAMRRHAVRQLSVDRRALTPRMYRRAASGERGCPNASSEPTQPVVSQVFRTGFVPNHFGRVKGVAHSCHDLDQRRYRA